MAITLDGTASTVKADVYRGHTGTGSQMGGDLDLNSNDITGTGGIPAANLTGTLPAIDGSNLTGLSSGSAKNIIINGNFDIWQRGTSFAAAADATYTADRWKYQKSGAMVHTVSRSTDVPTQAESGHLSNYSLLATVTTADGSIGAGDYCTLTQRMEGYNSFPIHDKTITISFWVKATGTNVTGVYCCTLASSGHNQNYPTEYTINSANTWEKKTVTLTIDTSAGTWGATNTYGMAVIFPIVAGSTYQGTNETWNTTNFGVGTSGMQTTALGTTSNTFQIAQVQLEVGSVATDFEIRDHATELAMCKRYYEKLNNTGNINWRFGAAQCVQSNVARGVIRWEVEKRAAPTITSSAVDYFSLTQSDYTKEAVTALTFATSDVWSARADISVAGNLVAGDVTLLESDASNAATIDISAEL